MRIDEDGKSIDLTIEEGIKLHMMGFNIICHDGKVIAIVQKDKVTVNEKEGDEK